MRTVKDNGRFLDMQSHQPTPMITAITTNLARVNHAVTSSSSIPPPRRHPCPIYMISLLPGEGDCFPNPKSTHATLIHSQISSARSFHPLHRQLFYRSFFLFHLLILTLRVFGQHNIGALNLKGIFSRTGSGRYHLESTSNHL